MLKYKCACKRFSLKLLRIRECFRDFINVSKYCLIKVVTAGVKLSDSSSGVPTYSIQTSPPRTGNWEQPSRSGNAACLDISVSLGHRRRKVTRRPESEDCIRDRSGISRAILFQMSILFLSAWLGNVYQSFYS